MTLLAQAATGGTSNTAEVILFVVFAVIALGAGIAWSRCATSCTAP